VKIQLREYLKRGVAPSRYPDRSDGAWDYSHIQMSRKAHRESTKSPTRAPRDIPCSENVVAGSGIVASFEYKSTLLDVYCLVRIAHYGKEG